jgi:hypothetical protein
MPVQVILNDVGFLLMAAALVWYALLLKLLLRIVRKPAIWGLPIIGAALLVVFVIGHAVAYSQFVPNLPAVWAFHGLWLCRFVSFAAVFVGGLLLSIVNWLYYRWTA